MNRAGELVTILVPTEREERVRDYTEDDYTEDENQPEPEDRTP